MIRRMFLLFFFIWFVSCGSSGSGSTTYTVGGTISGLTGTVVLQNNAGDDLSLTADGAFQFSTSLVNGTTYAVTVSTQPTGQTCEVTEGNGTIADANVTGVTVTCETITVTGFSKTSVSTPTDGEGEITIVFALSGALPEEAAPTLTVTGGGTAGECEVLEGRESVSCPITGLDGCETFTDYTVTISDTMITGYSLSFNSADDEFDNPDTLTNCWTKVEPPSTDDPEISGGLMSYNLVNSGTSKASVEYKALSTAGMDIAMLTYTAALSRPTSGSGDPSYLGSTISNIAHSNYFTVWNAYASDIGNVFLLVSYDNPSTSAGTLTGDLSSLYAGGAPLYTCLVHKDGHVTSYLSDDGITYTSTESNVDCAIGCSDPTDITEAAVTDAELLLLEANNPIESATLTGSYGYFRVKSSGITGTSSADCPTLTTE